MIYDIKLSLYPNKLKIVIYENYMGKKV